MKVDNGEKRHATEVDLRDHVEHLKQLLKLERDFEIATVGKLLDQLTPTVLQKRGLCLLGLRVTGSRTGLGGKTLLDFETGHEGFNPLPAHQIRVGDVVGLEEWSRSGKARKSESIKDGQEVLKGNLHGVVTRLAECRITIAIKDEPPQGFEERGWRINKLANDVSYDRMDMALKELESRITSSSTSLVNVLMGASVPQVAAYPAVKFFDDTLNASQKEAVKFCLATKEIGLIHGPPGTGKTHTVVELIRQLVKEGQRVLVCGPSNISVDNIVERLAPSKIQLARVGHPARVLPTVYDCTLDVQLRNGDAAKLILDIRKEMDSNLKSIAKSKFKSERRALWQENRELRKELRQRERGAVRNLLDSCRVVLTTLAGAGGKDIRYDTKFDIVVIDEATQSLEPETWIALLLAPKAILAGDHKQLPPTVKSPSAVSMGLERTIFDRLLDMYGDKVKRMLDTQYRMHQSIMDWSSKAMYDGKLRAFEAVRTRLLCELPGVRSTDETRVPLMMVDTAGCDLFEGATEDNDSKYNEGEAELVCRYLSLLCDAGLKPEDIGVITPYNGQVDLIRGRIKEIRPGLEVGSVDGFQGREKEAIVISLVRSNSEGDVGFLTESRRLNVAITRAKRHVCLICDSETIERGGSFLKGVVEWFNEHGENVLLLRCIPRDSSLVPLKSGSLTIYRTTCVAQIAKLIIFTPESRARVEMTVFASKFCHGSSKNETSDTYIV
ncbi:P-loop containing nucleoside triphosphate hydrolase protein [Gaertneriomyces semiglobifer]|nr:P-loop containing nucleoside triphosphate hydrolase protein [Gaertneriomyces semiglobifer]